MSTTSDRPPVPDDPVLVWFHHPKVKLPFLCLPQNNALPETPTAYGVHHETALTACYIIACNRAGFLSTSIKRSNANARVSLEHHHFLTSKRYYYHLATQPPDPNYRICIKFASWSFPHDHFPQLRSWARTTAIDDAGFQRGSHWTTISERIKYRDPVCKVTGWVDNKRTAHIVPVSALRWMRNQNMEIYAATRNQRSVDQDPRNLFALRWDIHSLQFDQGNFVIVPMAGRMVVHFIGESYESAKLYHNQPFDSSNLSHEFLYARFAWAVIKAACTIAESKAFNLETGVAGADADADTDTDAEVVSDGDGGGPSNPQQQSGDIKGKGTKRKRSDGPSGSKAVQDALELAEDIAKARKVAPFFRIAKPYAYENMVWYPGSGIIERKKLEYMEAHPNIRTTSGLCALPDADSEGTTD